MIVGTIQMGTMIKSTQTESLQAIMNRMAGRVAGHTESIESRESRGSRGVISEADAYAHFDPVLSALLKQYRDAESRHDMLAAQRGRDDAMALVAGDTVESLDATIQIRLMELRGRHALRHRAESLMEESIQSMAISARYRAQMNNDAHFLRAEARKDKMRKDAEDGYTMILFLWWMLQQTLQETKRRLSAASAFTAVSRPAHEREPAAA